jgi:CheY-like chemotaxis protein
VTKVLVVDDEGPVRSAVKRMLGLHGFEVTMASSYEEALQLLRNAPYEVLLTDLRMNGPDGLELIRATQASSPSTRPILMSAYATAKDSQMALDLGAVRVLCKPFEPTELLEAVRRAADSNEGFFGAVHGLSLIDLLQMFHYMRRSITVRLLGSTPASVSMQNGEVVDARWGADSSGEDALEQILKLPAGPIETAALEEHPRTIEHEFRALLLDQMCRLDEHNRPEGIRMSPSPPVLVAGFESGNPSVESWFDLSSEPKRSPQPNGRGWANRPELELACTKLTEMTGGSIACALVELEGGSLMAVSYAARNEALGHAMASTAHNLFRGPVSSAIDEAIQAQAQGSVEAASRVEEVLLCTGSALQFFRRLAAGKCAVVLVTNRSVNLAMTWLQLKSSLPALDALIEQPAESPQSEPARVDFARD